MAIFTFNPDSFDLEIGNARFTVRADSRFCRKLDRLSEECAARAAENDGCPDEFFAYLVNELLGDGATQKIFGCDVPDVYQCADVISFVCDEFTSFQNTRAKRYSPDPRRSEEGDPA